MVLVMLFVGILALPHLNGHNYTFPVTECIWYLLYLQNGVIGRPVRSHATVDYSLETGRTMEICAK